MDDLPAMTCMPGEPVALSCLKVLVVLLGFSERFDQSYGTENNVELRSDHYHGTD